MKRLDLPQVAGVQQVPLAEPGYAREINNLDYDYSLRCWSNEKGWVSYFATASQMTSSVWSIYNWSPNGRNEKTYVEFETNQGELTLALLAPYETAGNIPIVYGRHKPNPGEVGTTYATFGNELYFANGYDRIEKIVSFAPALALPFSFPQVPSAPVPRSTYDGGLQAGGSVSNAIHTWDGNNGFGNDDYVGISQYAKIGLGDLGVEETNAYQYKVSFITNNDSESPTSQPSQIVSWINGEVSSSVGIVGPTTETSRYGITLTNIPKGDINIVKRRLYRTKNLKEQLITGEQATYYFLDDIPNNTDTIYTDIIPDAELGSEAPLETDSSLIPQNSKFIATFGNRLVLAGGNSYPTRIFFSKAFRPEQFATQNFIEIGNREGGVITGLVPFDNLLLVFRERGIDALVPTQNPDAPFYATPVYTGGGTLASKSAVAVSGIGVIFATTEGVYVFSGNFAGGSQTSLVKISDEIGEYYARVSTSSLARANAIFDPVSKEYILSVPTDGESENNLLLVYNIGISSWSLRSGLPATCFANSAEGNVLFGTNLSSSGNPTPTSIGVLALSNVYGYTASYEAGTKPTGEYVSAWLDFGNADATKGVRGVSVDCYTTSKDAVYLDAGYDWDYDYPYTTIGTLDVADGNRQTYFNDAVIGTNKWENRRITKVRFDVELPDIRFFRFRLRSDVPLRMIGYTIFFDMAGETYTWSPTYNFPPFTQNNNQKVLPSKLPI